jgi:predicted nucleic acid-binding protein
MKYLVDSDWIIDCLHGDERAVDTLRELAPAGLATSIISVAEIYEGAYSQVDPDGHLETFRTFLRAFTVLSLTDSTADRFARTRAKLRSEGRAPPDFDLLIAATALDCGLVVITRNIRHFSRIQELELYKPDA